MRMLHTVDTTIVQDKVCPNCERRLAYFRFVDEVRTMAAQHGSPAQSDDP
jgi:hypothetical protein